MALSWHVAQTANGLLAEQELLQQRYDVFNPKVRVERKIGRKAVERIVPYLPGFIFIRFDVDADYWQPIRYTKGIKDFMFSSPGRPAPVRNGAIDIIRSMCDEDSCVPAPKADEFLFKVGDSVKVVEGPFAGFPGRVDALTAKRVQVFVSIFARETLVTLEHSAIELK